MLIGMDDTNVISVTDLWRRYRGPGRHGFDAVRGVGFSVRRGELFALLGTNGAGKTSTLEVLEGLAPPTSGTVRVLGHDPFRARRLVRPRTGIMLQEGGFPADLTVTETARMWAGTLAAPRPVEEALELVDLRQRARVRVRQLSGGERRRLGLAMAILGRPEVLFLDEPTAGLDPESRQGTWRLLGRLLESGTTVLLTTHYLQEADELADRLAIMHRGRIVRTGTPAEVAATQPARICFELPAGTREPVPDLPGAVAGNSSRGTVLVTEDLQQTLTALLDWANQRGVRLHDLTARSASLEEAFLAIAESGGEPGADEPAEDGEVAA
jgi:ABC-2 type transport system ATP-binding protein